MTGIKNKILIVEDDPKNLKLERDLLTVGGFEVVTASDAESGIVMAQEGQPSVIIMDYLLPGMSGVEAMNILMANEKTKNIPKAFVSASVTKELMAKMAEFGCKIITKPIDTRKFVEEIRGLIK